MQSSLVCLTITTIITLCYFIKTTAYKTKPNRNFAQILLSANIFLALSSIYAIKLADLSVVNLKLVAILKHLYFFVLTSLIALLWCTYKYIVKKYKRNKYEELFFTVLCIGAVISTYFLDSTIKFDKYYYFTGNKIYPSYWVWIMFMLLCLAAEIRNFKETTLYHKITECMILFFVGFSVILQIFYPASHFCVLGVAILVVMLYIINENPDIKQADQEREINKQKNRFVSMVSHELRTPMNIICGMAEIMQETKLTKEQKGYLDNIQKSGQSLLYIINDILDYNKINEGKLDLTTAPYDFYNLMGDIETMLRIRIGSKPLKLIVNVDENVPKFLIGDKNRVKQILINFINNAIKFTQKGEVKVNVISTIEENGLQLNFAISDTGQGIKQEDLGKLFKAFGQVNKEQNKDIEGTGLGLSINKQLIEMMGGAVSVESEYGKGSTFSFNILQEISPVAPRQTNENKTFICPTANIAVVDDNKLNLDVFTGLMNKYKANIRCFQSGKELIEAVKIAKYDIIFVDRMMPELSGEDTIKGIRQYDRFVSIISLTADLSAEAKSEMTLAGADSFLTKPIDSKLLRETLLNYIPREKIVFTDNTESDTEQEEDVNIQSAVRNCGSKELFLQICQTFHDSIDNEIAYLKKTFNEGRLDLFTIKVHALKGSCFLLGNTELGDECFDFEKAGKGNNISYISEYAPALYSHLKNFKDTLTEYIPKQEYKPMDKDAFKTLLNDLSDTLILGDIKTSDLIILELKKYPVALLGLDEAINEFDTERALKLIEKLRTEVI